MKYIGDGVRTRVFFTCLEIESFGQSPTLVLKHINKTRKQGSSVKWRSSVTEMRS